MSRGDGIVSPKELSPLLGTIVGFQIVWTEMG